MPKNLTNRYLQAAKRKALAYGIIIPIDRLLRERCGLVLFVGIAVPIQG